MNTIGIDDNLDRPRIRKLLWIGLFGTILTGIGDFLLGYGENVPSAGFAAGLLASAPNLSDAQLFAGAMLGVPGIFLEGLAYFAVYRLMADAAPKYAHVYRAGIFGYIWLAPIGCHMNVGVLNFAYKYLLRSDAALGEGLAGKLVYGFSLPIYLLLFAFWLPAIVVQFKAFGEGMTPYPRGARWFNLFTGAIPCLLVAALLGADSALGAGVGTMCLSCGNFVIFGGLLATLPDEARFAAFRREIAKKEGLA